MTYAVRITMDKFWLGADFMGMTSFVKLKDIYVFTDKTITVINQL